MTTLTRIARGAGLFAALLLVATMAILSSVPTPDVVAHTAALALPDLGALGIPIGIPVIALGVRNMLPAKILSYAVEALAERQKPQSANVADANPDVLYDTVTYLLAGVARLTAFGGVAPAGGDVTLSNMKIPGALPAGKWFDVHRVHIRPLALITETATVAGRLQDILTLYNGARGVWSFDQNDKPVGPFPMALAGDYGPVGGHISANMTPPISTQVPAGAENGGFPVNGAWKIGGDSPNFSIPMQFNSTAIVADLQLQVLLLGVSYRRLS